MNTRDDLTDRLSVLAGPRAAGPLPHALARTLARRRLARRATRAGAVLAGFGLVVLVGVLLRPTADPARLAPPGTASPAPIAAARPMASDCLPTLAAARAAVLSGDLSRLPDCPPTRPTRPPALPVRPRSPLADL